MKIIDILFGIPNIEKLKEKRDFDRLTKALKHKRWDIRLHAAVALSGLGDQRGTDFMVGVLKQVPQIYTQIYNKEKEIKWEQWTGYSEQRKQWDVRVSEVVKALEKVGDANAVAVLINTLEELNIMDSCLSHYVLDVIVDALGEIADNKAVVPIVRAMQRWSTVKISAIVALGRIGSQEAIASIISALIDRDEYVRNNAMNALRRLKDSPITVDCLIAALRDENWAIRTAAAECIGQLGYQQAVKPLVALLKDRYYCQYSEESLLYEDLKVKISYPVRIAVLNALKLIGGQDAELAIAENEQVWDYTLNIADRLVEISHEHQQAHKITKEQADLFEQEVREIGLMLFERGGLDLMRDVYSMLVDRISLETNRKIKMLWKGIGTWKG